MLALCRSLILNQVVLSLAARQAPSWTILWAAVANFDYLLFAWATRFVDVSIAAVLLETWAVFFILLTGWLLRAEGLYRSNFHSIFPFLVVALKGLCPGGRQPDRGIWQVRWRAFFPTLPCCNRLRRCRRGPLRRLWRGLLRRREPSFRTDHFRRDRPACDCRFRRAAMVKVDAMIARSRFIAS